MRTIVSVVTAIFVSLLLASCVSQEQMASEPEAITVSAGHGRTVIGPLTVAQFPEGIGIRGVAGDTAVIFTAMPASAPGRSAGVYAVDRLTGNQLGAVTAPPGGWLVPLSVKVTQYVSLGLDRSRGEFLVLDASVPPPGGTAPAHVYRYTYAYDPSHGLATALAAASELPLNTLPPGPGSFPNGIIYPASLALLPGGLVAVSDSGGAIWVSDDASLGSWRMAFFSPADTFGVGGPITGFGRDGHGGTKPYTFLTPGMPGMPPGVGLYPGIEPLAYVELTREVAFAVVRGAGESGVFAISLDTLLAPGFPIKPYRPLVTAAQGGDLVDGLDVNRYQHDSPWVYFQRAPCEDLSAASCNALRRVHVQTGVIQDLASGVDPYDWTAELGILPPLLPDSPCTTVASATAQEYNNPDINMSPAYTPMFVSPSPVPVTIICDRP